MTWQPADCHAHTTWSDGALDVAALVNQVRARGVRPAVTDHVSRDVGLGVKSEDAVRAYVAELENYDIARGAEFCWHDSLWRELPDDLLSRLTHRIGSIHAVHMPAGGILHLFSRDAPDGLTPENYMDMHLLTLERFAAEMPVHILAHPTLVFLPYRSIPGEELWTEEHEERAVRALSAAGITFELSARYPPHERLVMRARDAGLRFSLGSDGHSAAQVGDITDPLALARRIGVADLALFDPLRDGAPLVRNT
jgi:histidinol phosphatase-like PHP family hydrolase